MENVADEWLEAVAKEIRATTIYPKLKTIYIGGGTPTSLTRKQLEQLLTLLDPYSQEIKEYTIEVNPETIDETKVQILAKHHVNRISMGFQTSNDKLLKLIGRHHSLAMVQDCMNLFRKHGIDNISLDLMYSLPTQTMSELQKAVYDAIALKPKHLSLYSLTIEENTVFGKKGYQHLDDDLEADMYEWISKELPKHGFHQYEISNYALDNYESLHNKAYWHYDDFYGISCGASGKNGYIRYDHSKSLKEYLLEPLKVNEIVLTKQDAMFEMVMMGLRLKKGMSLELFENRFGCRFDEVYGLKAKMYFEQGLLVEKEGYVTTSDSGFERLNDILVDLL